MDRPRFSSVVDDTGIAQMTGAFGGLQPNLMVGVHLLMLDNTSLGKREALGSTTMRFLFRQGGILLPFHSRSYGIGVYS